MKAIDIVEKHIRDVAQRLTEKVGAEIGALRSEIDRRFGLEDKARNLVERRQEMDLADVRKGIAAVDTLAKSLTEQREAFAELATQNKSAVDLRIKSAEDAVAAQEQKHQAELLALRKDLDSGLDALRSGANGSAIEALTKEVGALKKSLADAKAAGEAGDTALRASLAEAQATTVKVLAETADAHRTELAKIAKSMDEIPEIPELPAELAALPQSVRALGEKLSAVEKQVAAEAEQAKAVRQLMEKIAKETGPSIVKTVDDKLSEIQKAIDSAKHLASGCMRFAGQWDERGEYSIGSTVAFKNSLWVAKRDNDLGTPGDRDSGWKMCIKSGKLITPYEHR